MPKCVKLRRYDRVGRAIQLVAYDEATLFLMEQILGRAYPGAEFEVGVPHLGRYLEEVLTVVPPTPEPAGLEPLCRLLVVTVTIEDELDECHALDFHQHEDDFGELVRTEIGGERHRAKFQNNIVDRQSLVKRLAAFIAGHPTYSRAQFVSGIPAATGGEGGLATLLAADVAGLTGKSVWPVSRASARQQQKNVDHEDRATGIALRQKNQHGSMQCPEGLKGAAVIVLDDLYGSGASLAEAARALRQAGAGSILGLAVTKQLKFTKY